MEAGGNLHNVELQGVYRRQYYCGDHVTEDDTYEACGAHSRELKSVQDFVGNLKERAPFADLDVGGKITFKRILNK
jgi:hypothetical protein